MDLISFAGLPVRAWGWSRWRLAYQRNCNLILSNLSGPRHSYPNKFLKWIFQTCLWIFMASYSIASAGFRYAVAMRAFVRPSRSHWRVRLNNRLNSMDLLEVVRIWKTFVKPVSIPSRQAVPDSGFGIWEIWCKAIGQGPNIFNNFYFANYSSLFF